MNASLKQWNVNAHSHMPHEFASSFGVVCAFDKTCQKVVRIFSREELLPKTRSRSCYLDPLHVL